MNRRSFVTQSSQGPAALVSGFHISLFSKNKDRRLISCPIEDACKSTASVQPAMSAHYAGTTVQWDTAYPEITNTHKTAKLPVRDYRAPYQRPEV